MEILAAVPAVFTWLVAGCAGACALASLARGLDAMLDLDAR